MKPFRFGLARLLWLRESREQDQARVLGDALRGEREQRAALERAEAGIERAGEQSADPAAAPRPAGAVRNVGLTLQAAVIAADAAAAAHRQSQEDVAREQEAFGEARKDRRVLEKLREKRKEGWSADHARAEQRESDGLTESRRHTQGEES
jgi:flagellar export protein FliJ